MEQSEQLAATKYLHLYLGCPITYEVWGQACEEVYGVRRKKITTTLSTFVYRNIIQGDFEWPYNIILRPLSDMTSEEFREIFKPLQPKDIPDEELKDTIQSLIDGGMETCDFDGVSAHTVFEYTRQLLSKHFDLFGLIPNGLAIDATTINNEKTAQ